MTDKEKKHVIDFLKSFGWSEERNVDPCTFDYTKINTIWDDKCLGTGFYMFDMAKNFFKSFGGLELKWENPKNIYGYKLIIDGRRAGVGTYYLKWYMMYVKKLLYPVAEYHNMPGEMLIDTDGNFYFVRDCYICEVGNDFFEILNDLLNRRITAGMYKEIFCWDELGYTDEFIEQWDYNFDEIPDIPYVSEKE